MPALNQAWECVAELRGHSSWIYGVPMTTSGMLASVSGSQILFWNLKTREIDAVLEGHTDIICSLSLSSDGQTLASGSLDKTIGLWSLETKDLICTLAKRKDPIHSVAFSPDGKLLASGGENKYKTASGQKTTIYLWNINRKELIQTFPGHNLRVNTLAFSPDSQTLASGSNDATIRLWDVDSGRELHILEGHSSNISTVAFTSDANSLISSGGGGVKIWNVQTGELQQTFAEEFEYVKCLAVDPTGQFLAFSVHDGIEIWNLKDREKVQCLNFKWPVSMNFSFDGKLLASGDATAFAEGSGSVKVWCVQELESMPNSTAENSDRFELDAEHQKIESEGYLDPATLEDAKRQIIRSIVQRQGQAEFRRKLLNSYGNRCPITDCDVDSAIEAAHISPYEGTGTNHPTNGLPLRADIHTLFDLHLLSIQPDTYDVVIAPELTGTCYQNLASRKLTLPQDEKAAPSQKALNKHHETFIKKRKSGHLPAS
jgi:WD40 repeat protein